jgi:hypothetical protein
LQSGNTNAVSQALASASANVNPLACTLLRMKDLLGDLARWHSKAMGTCANMHPLEWASVQVDETMTHCTLLQSWSPCNHVQELVRGLNRAQADCCAAGQLTSSCIRTDISGVKRSTSLSGCSGGCTGEDCTCWKPSSLAFFQHRESLPSSSGMCWYAHASSPMNPSLGAQWPSCTGRSLDWASYSDRARWLL